MADRPGSPPTGHTVAVIGASLGGLAAAVRLAKLGHRVTLVDESPAPAPAVPERVELPAAWRDLFRKSGRILDAALGEAGLSLVPAPPTVLSDGVALPDDRGAQYAALSAAYGSRTADDWRDLVDGLDAVWQVVRRAGLESELDPTDAPALRLLTGRTTVADLAARVSQPALAQVVLDVARDRGCDPAHAPAWWAARLAVRRTFGQWQVVDADGRTRPGTVLAALLTERARHRGVDVLVAAAGGLEPHPDGVTVRLSGTAGAGALTATAVVSAVDLWRHKRLIGFPPPAVPRHLGPLPLPPRLLAQAADGRASWERADTWRALEPVSGSTHRVWYAGSGSVAGDLPWARVLVGALATYALHEALTGRDVRPANVSGHRARPARVGPAA